MRVMQFSRFGGPEVLELVERPIPVPDAGQVLVRVHAAGVNLAEALMRANRYAVTPSLPAVPGSEVAGTVEAVGRGVRGVERGMRVAVPLFASGSNLGGYAEYVSADASLLVPLPDSLSFDAATALMLQGVTALYLVRRIPANGKTVLVSAAAGGVGSLLVQLARRAGATSVIAAASTPAKLDLARRLGADAGVNYTDADWVEQVRAATAGAGPDIIYESTGGAVTRAALEALAPGGTLVIYGALNIQEFHLGVPELIGLIFRNQSVAGFALPTLLTPEGLRRALAELFDLAACGTLEVTVGGTYSLEHAAAAHRALEARRTVGKLVLLP